MEIILLIFIIIISIVFIIRRPHWTIIDARAYEKLVEESFINKVKGIEWLIEFYEPNKKSKNNNKQKQIKKLK